VRITRPWDGSGMRATQSHAVALDGAPATRAAWPFGALASAPFAGIVMWTSWVSIVAAVIDEAVAEARGRLEGRRAELRPYEASEWVRPDLEHFQIRQIAAGCRAALDRADPEPAEHRVSELALDALRSKLAVAELAESIMSRVSRVMGGGTFSASSPISSWYEDVRALGFLRPPWALGYDQLLAATLPDE
jgi:alkylation response protein AidB-like acyl-CoA dehydrogenase